MPANNDLKKSIQTALRAFGGQPMAEAARGLLHTLGYQSARTLKITPNTAQGFQAMFGRDKPLKAEARLQDWLSVDLLFQVTEAEIQGSLKGQGNFTAAKVDNTDIHSYLFFAVELKDQQYTRTQLSGITRTINRLFESIPALIIFKYGGLLSIGIIARRLSKKDNNKDVLEKVTIIKDISLTSPHRAHVEILHDLSIGELQSRVGFGNFAELQKAWEQVLDTSALNKKFFRELADWYFWAVDTVKFPKDAETQMSVIRLITRLIFVWFIKEKGLVPPELFDERRLKDLLYFNDPQKNTYYKAILQNLFFATLNTEMGAGRKFRSRNKNPNGLDGNHGVTTLYRYEEQFKAPQAALKFFANIPFLNGGLFECLDKPEEKLYIDGFSDNPKNQPSLPDELFFGLERPVDLSAAYGDVRRSHENVRGLIPIFNDYKFTIEENTPIEEEVALDPELLGKVFENLLAAYNPETGTTARKQTGSFYTPREIVNYMVDEALIAYLDSAMSLPAPVPQAQARDGVLPSKQSPANNKGDASQSTLAHGPDVLTGMTDRLRHLFAYNDQAPLFNEAEILKLIESINNLKALDPACGSGAFPMGLLHKLVFILKKLDPDNTRWREFQLAKVADFPELIGQVEASFKNNHDDYGRKLYLIQNCIYGVDIQPIAVQIAKLRVFISLVVEQKVDDSQPNRGILPLPNLETKFIAANSLIGINRPGTKPVDEAPTPISPELEKNCKQLLDMLRQYLIVSNPETKARYLVNAQGLGEEINTALENDASFQPLNINKIFSTAKDTAALKALLPINREAKASVLVLRNLDIDEKEKQLAEARKRYFSARTPETKAKYRQKDKELRGELADLLKKDGWGSETAQQLAGWDPYDQNAHAEFFDPEWMFGLNKGFDVVIGNPPYLNVDDAWGKKDIRLQSLKRYYPQIYNDKTDLLFYFLGRSVELSEGCVTFITSRAFLEAYKADKLRKFLSNSTSITQIIDFQNYEVFDNTGITTCIITFFPGKGQSFVQVYKFNSDQLPPSQLSNLLFDENIFDHIEIKQNSLSESPWLFTSSIIGELNTKIDSLGVSIDKILIVGSGMQTGRNDVFAERTLGEIKKWQLKPGMYFKHASNSDIQRYHIRDREEYVLYLESVHDFSQIPKGVQHYLLSNADVLKNRAACIRGNCEWWKYTWPLRKEYYHRHRLISPYMATYNRFALDVNKVFLSLTDTTVFFDNEQRENLLYILALLNSKVLTFRFKSIGKLKGRGIYEYVWNSVSKLPIHRIDFSNSSEKAKHDRLVILVESMMSLKLRRDTEITPSDQEKIDRRVEEIDEEINQLVYGLYGLTEEEIKVVEGNALGSH